MSSSTLTRKGQTTIPKDIRDRLNLKPGDKIKFLVNADGSVRLVAANLTLRDLRGILPRPERAGDGRGDERGDRRRCGESTGQRVIGDRHQYSGAVADGRRPRP